MNDDRQAGSEEIGGGGEWTALREALPTIKGALQSDLANAEDAICRAEYQQRRMPFDHDNNDALIRYQKWRERMRQALAAVEALAAAAPAPHAKSCKCGNELARCEACGEIVDLAAPPPQDGQGAELLGPPSITPVNTHLALAHSAFKEVYLQENLLGPPKGGSSSDLAAQLAQARLEALEEAAAAFQEEYCKHDSPLLGVARGVEAIRGLKEKANR